MTSLFSSTCTGKGQAGAPRRAVGLVFQVELGGGGVLHTGGGAHVVVHFGQQIGFPAAAEIQDLVVAAARVLAEVVAPQQGGGAGAEKIGELHAVRSVDDRACRRWSVPAPGVAGLVEPEMHLAVFHVHQVGAAAAVEVRQEQAPGS